MEKRSIFKTSFADSGSASDPELLFRNLHGRASNVRHLWSQQADILRAYHREYLSASDVAIELPTGAGKTLIGLLIAEWRRQSFKQRVAYLCPTKQLAIQVGAQAMEYGINARVLIGPQAEYQPEAFSDYQSGQQIAITTYSGIFNNNPRIDSAQTLILDDAHAGENFIAGMWSVEISREDHSLLYLNLVNLLKDAFSATTYADLRGESERESINATKVELIPGSVVRANSASISDLLNNSVENGTPPWYAWNNIKTNLAACNIFVAGYGILIRPLIPPTHLFDPFISAEQRIYMSATLGLGGELERVTGIKRIQRLPLPSGWENRGSGRRFFVFPQNSVSDNKMLEVVCNSIEKQGRGLILFPSRFDEDGTSVVKELEARDVPILRASDIEDSLDPFIQLSKGALVLSRYDGLDLPDETCRQVIIAGLPCGSNLQEKFLWSRIAAHSLLRDRILTRFSQGVGRCTRSDNDYAVVFVVGRRLVEFMLKLENRRLLHPELQAEIRFGIENSRNKRPNDFADQIRAFFEQNDQWTQAEHAIESLRNQVVQKEESEFEQLQNVVSDEIVYVQSKWRGDLEDALQYARKVSDALNGDSTRSYRAWWYYLSADAAMALSHESGKQYLDDSAKDLLKRAANCCPTISWFIRLNNSITNTEDVEQTNELNIEAIDGIRHQLTEWGSVGPRFEKSIELIGNNLQATPHKTFHQGLLGLGRMLGFDAQLPEGNAVPDCVWSLGSHAHIVFEAKSEHNPTNPIGVNDITQACRHGNWAKSELPTEETTKIVCLIVSPRETITKDGIVHSVGLCHVTLTELQELHFKFSACLRRIRSKIIELQEEFIAEELINELSSEKLLAEEVIDGLMARRVMDMDSEKA